LVNNDLHPSLLFIESYIVISRDFYFFLVEGCHFTRYFEGMLFHEMLTLVLVWSLF